MRRCPGSARNGTLVVDRGDFFLDTYYSELCILAKQYSIKNACFHDSEEGSQMQLPFSKR